MASGERPDQQRQGASASRYVDRREWRVVRDATYDYLAASPQILTIVIVVLGPVFALRLIGLYYTDFEPRWSGPYPTEYAYTYRYEVRLPDLQSFQNSWLKWSPPWPQYEKGIPGWYRQGLLEVRENRSFIEALTNEEQTSIILAAAIFNQGNSVQRLFGWEGLERLQVWLGQNLEWPLSRWTWAHNHWVAWFEQYSVGIGQITPAEVKRLGFKLSKTDLFDEHTSIRAMHAKLNHTYKRAIALGLNRTDALVLMMVSNNNEFDTIENFQKFDQNIQRFLVRSPYAQRQLTRMMTYIHHLNVHEYWPLPANVDWDYLCRLAKMSWDEE